jgi:O-acetyl-ADP-ribose deacetylase (regulator of RNase III)
MIKYLTGDMFEQPADIRVNTVNCAGVMGAGIALAFKNRYPAMFKEYKKKCKNGKIVPGKIDVWKEIDGNEVINLPTKDHWRQKSKYEYVEAGLETLKQYLAKKGKVRVTLPALGCGHGGLNWHDVQKLIEKYLDNLEAEIFVFQPDDSRNFDAEYRENNDKKSAKNLEKIGAVSIQPEDKLFPSSLKGIIKSPMYLLGNTDLLKSPILSVTYSKKPKQEEIDATLPHIQKIARHGITFLVGYEFRLSRPAIKTVLERGSNVIIIIDKGILDFKVTKDLKDVWDENRILVISPFNPNKKWNDRNYLKIIDLMIYLPNTILISDKKPTWLSQFKEKIGDDFSLFYVKYKENDSKTHNLLESFHAKPLNDIDLNNESQELAIVEDLINPETNDESFDTEFQPASKIDEHPKISDYSKLN